MCVNLTASAAAFMQRMVRFGGVGADAGFRLSVKPGGCSGFDSSFSVEPAPQAEDAVIEQHGVKLFLTADSCELLRGYDIDFVESRMDSSFKFSKPGEPQACGCGAGQPAAKATVVFMPRSASCVKK